MTTKRNGGREAVLVRVVAFFVLVLTAAALGLNGRPVSGATPAAEVVAMVSGPTCALGSARAPAHRTVSSLLNAPKCAN